MGRNGPGAFVQRVRRHGVVVVRQHQEISRSHGNSRVGVVRNAPVSSQILVADPGVLFHIGPDDLFHVFSLGAAIRQTQLPLSVGLLHDGVQHHPQIAGRGLVQRHYNGKQRAIGHRILPLPLQLFLRRLGQFIPLAVVIVVVQPLNLVHRFDKQRPQAVFLPEIHGHMDGFHIHQIPDFLQPLVGHAGPPGNQRLIITDPCLSAIAADHQPVIPPPLIGELDVESEIPVIGLSIIDLAYVVPPGGHIPELHRLALGVQHRELRHRIRRLPDDPAVELYRIFPDPDYIYIMLHFVPLLCPALPGPAP